MTKLLLRISAALLLFLLPAAAQTTTGSIVGTVTDPSGGVVSGAGVTVTNMGTGISVKTNTDSAGNYVVTPLLVGRYSVSVEATGFKKAVASDITVNVQDRVRVDLTLEVGAVAETVEVTGAAPTLQTDTSYLGQVVDSQRIMDLPLNGRYFTRLAVLAPGTAPTPAGARDEKTGGFSANGVRPYQNNYLLDGIDNNSLSEDLVNDASFVLGPPPDAIGEFRVQTNSMSAEFGRSGGAVMNVTIKSGTNDFHGTFFEFLRNSKLDAKNYFDAGDQPIPPFKLNQFGASGGGPVLIPGLYNGKNKTFFFADYQGTRIRTGRTFLASVPIAAWRNGDFSGFDKIYDPATTATVGGRATRQPFAGNIVPASRFDTPAKKLIDQFPQPNTRGDRDSSGVANNLLTNPSEPDETNHFDVRMDHQFSNKDTFFARFSFSNQDLTPPSSIPAPLGGADFGSGNFLNYARNAVISETHIFTPRTINEFRAGYTRNRSLRLQFNADQNTAAQLGIPGIPFASNNGGLPAFDVNGLNSFGGAQYQPTVEISNVIQISDNLSLIRGKHTFKLGAEIKPRVNFTILQPESPRGFFGFSGDFTKDPQNENSTGLGTADFLLGALSSANITSFVDNTFQQPGYFFYLQDDWKVTRKLTLNLGLRYDFVFEAREKYDAQGSFNLWTGALDIVKGRNDPLPSNFIKQIPINRNAPRELVPNDKNNFGPRIGFAYNIRPKTVIRGGYGIFYTSYEAGPLSIPNMGNNPPFFQKATFDEDSIVVPNRRVNRLSQGFPADSLSQPEDPELFALDPGFRNPYVQHWNMSVQQDLGRSMVFELSYAGSKGTKLYEFRNGNQATPTADSSISRNSRRPRPFISAALAHYCSCNSSTYSGLLAKLEKRFSGGLSLLSSYTWGKSIDERSQASLGFHNGGGIRDQRHPDWEKSRSDYDIAHRFVTSYTYELPFGHGKKFGASAKGAANHLIGGWQLMGIHAFQTGTPRTVRANRGVSNADGENRPDRILGVETQPGSKSPSQWFNAAAFRPAVPGTFGNSGRNIIT
ncbi:MAG: TonB-dependent receptor, partial [Acidobacteria bacterium]|nr:TonB-dependent receptor [Acidobacteriota bacterium]